MKFFIINSFRFIVYIAYFAIIAVQTLGFYVRRADFNDQIWRPLTNSNLTESGVTATSIIFGLVSGWFAATIICGLLVTLLDIRDDINDRLPNARAK